ncbi:hypothetical protein [Idiomarina sp. HP20-50]|uniref:hypothetical protein n=1 Tax=Idiomarina sp. HP20-50 TaxID=3070813 RepID=UPI00294B16A3|nr:hypothetical protein [Idiomarina sp. HP20-50]MDV6315607.1 hypothetical protein [Idiomarina sp. HP20-50]
MKKWIVALSVAGTLMSSSVLANEYDSLEKQMNILAEILETSVEQESEKGELPISRFEYSYLKGQGVVLFADSGRMPWRFVVPNMPEPPMPPDVGEMNEFAERMDLDAIIEQGLRSAHRVLGQLNGEYSNEWVEMAESARDTAWEIRDKERELRDLEFELRTADESRQTGIEKEKKQLEMELSNLREEQKALQQQASSLKLKLKEKRRELEEKRVATRESLLKRFETTLANTLCTYGVTLKSLPENEKVNVILRDFYPSKQGESQDQLYVFDKSELIQCVTEGNAQSLIESASRYRF